MHSVWLSEWLLSWLDEVPIARMPIGTLQCFIYRTDWGWVVTLHSIGSSSKLHWMPISGYRVLVGGHIFDNIHNITQFALVVVRKTVETIILLSNCLSNITDKTVRHQSKSTAVHSLRTIESSVMILSENKSINQICHHHISWLNWVCNTQCNANKRENNVDESDSLRVQWWPN